MSHMLNGDFIAFLREQGLSEKTVATYRSALMCCLTDYESVTDALEDKKLAYRTKQLYRVALRRWAEYQKDTELFSFLGSKKALQTIKEHSPRVDKRVVPLSQGEFNRLLVAVDALKAFDDWKAPAMVLLIKLGLRAKIDLCGLRRDAVEHALKTESPLAIWTKRGKQRLLPIAPVRDALETLLRLEPTARVTQADGAKLGAPTGGWEILADLISPQAAPETRTRAAYEQVRKLLKVVAEAAGLSPEEVYPHRLRHTVAHKLYEETNDLILVNKFLEHESITTTMKYLQDERIEQIGAALEEMYRS